jgi:hypothetical protein
LPKSPDFVQIVDVENGMFQERKPMNELIERPIYLPDTIEDLTDFILIGKEILKVHEAKIRAIKSVDMADKVQKIAQEDAHTAGTQVVYAEAKLGELLKSTDQSESKFDSERGSSHRTTSTLPSKITKKLSHESQTISSNPEKVAQIISKAKEEGKIPTPASVYKKIKDSEKTEIKKPSKKSKSKKKIIGEKIGKRGSEPMGQEFKEAYDAILRAIKNEKAIGWETTSQEVALKYIDILKDIIEL